MKFKKGFSHNLSLEARRLLSTLYHLQVDDDGHLENFSKVNEDGSHDQLSLDHLAAIYHFNAPVATDTVEASTTETTDSAEEVLGDAAATTTEETISTDEGSTTEEVVNEEAIANTDEPVLSTDEGVVEDAVVAAEGDSSAEATLSESDDAALVNEDAATEEEVVGDATVTIAEETISTDEGSTTEEVATEDTLVNTDEPVLSTDDVVVEDAVVATEGDSSDEDLDLNTDLLWGSDDEDEDDESVVTVPMDLGDGVKDISFIQSYDDEGNSFHTSDAILIPYGDSYVGAVAVVFNADVAYGDLSYDHIAKQIRLAIEALQQGFVYEVEETQDNTESANEVDLGDAAATEAVLEEQVVVVEG